MGPRRDRHGPGHPRRVVSSPPPRPWGPPWPPWQGPPAPRPRLEAVGLAATSATLSPTAWARLGRAAYPCRLGSVSLRPRSRPRAALAAARRVWWWPPHRRQVVSERIDADAKERHGLARAPLRRRSKAHIQALLTAAAINLKPLAARRPRAEAGGAALARRP